MRCCAVRRDDGGASAVARPRGAALSASHDARCGVCRAGHIAPAFALVAQAARLPGDRCGRAGPHGCRRRLVGG